MVANTFTKCSHIGRFYQIDQKAYLMDSIDRAILRELQADGRLTNQELSERVNLSPSPCLRRVRNLEKAGIIEGYTAQVNQEAYGLPINVFLTIRLERPDEELIKKFESAVKGIDEILECYLMTGSTDYILRIVTADLKTYEQLIKKRITKIPGIGSLESSFAFGLVKKTNQFPSLRTIIGMKAI